MIFNIFRFVAFLEGISFLLFGLTMPLKYVWGMKEPNMYVGFAHGFLFMAYVILLVWVAVEKKWNLGKSILSFLVAFIPFGTFIADKRLFNN